MKNDYIPARDGDLYAWETNFLANVDPVAKALGIPQADVDAVKQAVTDHQGNYNAGINAQKAALSANALMRSSRTGTVKVLRQLAARFKTAPAYTEDMGKQLGIIGADSEFDHANAKPHLKLSVQGGNVVITFNNPREVDGVKIFCKRAGETAYTFLAVDTESPYEDNRDNLAAGVAEKRSYYAYFFHDDGIIGQQSDEVSVSITK
jgi:hypothetical protein